VVDVSYGLDVSESVTPLVGPGAAGRVHIPAGDPAGTGWTSPTFDDAGWSASSGAVGYDVSVAPERVPGFTGRVVDLAPGGADATVDSLREAVAILDGPIDPARYAVFSDTRSEAPTALYQSFVEHHQSFWGDPRETGLAIRVTADVFIPAGDWTILPGPDGFRLRLPGVKFITKTNENAVGADELVADDTLLVAPVAPGGGSVPVASGTFTIPEGGLRTTLLLDSFSSKGFGVTIRSGHGTTGPAPLLEDGALGWSVTTTSSAPPVDYRPLIGTHLGAAMRGVSPSAYLRLPLDFDPAAGDPFDLLRLRMRYDDGFVAYLNGVEVARRNAPAGTFGPDAAAIASRPDAKAMEFEEFTLSPALLAPGRNVLAIHGLNDAASSPDFLIGATLDGVKALGSDARYFAPPTPDARNAPSDLTGVVDDTKFSVDRGLYEAPFDVEITSLTPGATIHYTTDGTPPTATTGTIYSGPVHVTTTTTLRAAAFNAGAVPSNVDTQTYVFANDVARQDDTPPPGAPPVGAGGVHWDYGMNPEVTNHPTYGPQVIEALRGLPTLSIVARPEDLFGPAGVYSNPTGEGSDWERPVSAELFYPDGTKQGFQIDAGLRVYGGYNRTQIPKHSLRLTFRGRYGDGTLKYPLFADAPFGDTAADEFDSIVLRGGYNDSVFGYPEQYIRDQFISDTQLAMGQPSKHGTFVHLYLNGEYWGLYNPVERPDAAFAATYLGGEKDEYDALNAGSSVDGDGAAWLQLLAAATRVRTDPTAYEQVKQYLDIDGFIDYLLINFYGGNNDWGTNGNWYAARKREPGATFKFFSWDAEATLLITGPGPRASSPGDLYSKLRNSPEFRLAFADRVQRHAVNPGGALTPEAVRARYTQLAAWVEQAIVPESARWGDWSAPGTHTIGNADWISERNRIMNSFATRTSELIRSLKTAGLYPAVNGPAFSQQGGTVAPGFSLTMSVAAGQTGVIYYTLDGSDPRLPGGGISPTAIRYTGPVPLTRPTTVKARVYGGPDDVTWSAANVATFAFDLSALRVTEVMYHPADPPPGGLFTEDSDFEFIEVRNTSAAPMFLGGVRFTEGIRFTFGDVTLAPGQRAVVVRNADAFRSRYGDDVAATIAGTFDGALDNSGERLRLEGPGGQTLADFRYDDDWLPRTDGQGYSLVVIDPSAPPATLGDPASWRASAAAGGAPGRADLAAGQSAAVTGRRLFYNASKFDGKFAGADARDDDAVASDKSALLPGGAVVAANVSSYSRGLNGIMIDIDGLVAPPTPGDFEFKMAGPGGIWVDAPAPLAVTRRVGAGANGSDRVTIVWPDGAVKNTWLRVTLKATARTGLAAADVFSFGSLVGDTGNDAGPFRVNAVDLAAVKLALNRVSSPAARADFNRDGVINALDLGLAKANLNRTLAGATAESAPVAAARPEGASPGRVWDDAEPNLLA
jgi:hypothetical protein